MNSIRYEKRMPLKKYRKSSFEYLIKTTEYKRSVFIKFEYLKSCKAGELNVLKSVLYTHTTINSKYIIKFLLSNLFLYKKRIKIEICDK